MSSADYVVFTAYVVGTFAVGAMFSRFIKSSGEMFAAGNQSPWWVSGLSGFMTMFSAGTFVVWGSIAYQQGLVAIVINLTYGIAALVAGWFVAGKWRELGVDSAAEFLELRFGKAAVMFCTVTNISYRLVTVSVALYSIAVILAAVVELPEGNWLADPSTGSLHVGTAIVLLGALVVVYTVLGGLWAVLMTDVLQFVVLMTSVAFVVPLLLVNSSGWESMASSAPEGFFNFTSHEWTWWVLAGWCFTQFFMIGAEWAFVQRFICVPTDKDARKSAYLFGALYLVSPVLWMLPPLLYRLTNPNANPEQAYILACQSVLPDGLSGLMLAAMFSATASMVDSQLNVFAGVLTGDFYKRYFKPLESHAHYVTVGRVITTILGCVVIGFALNVRRLGGATDVIVAVSAMLAGPSLLPTLWGLFSKRVTASCIWYTVGISFGFGAVVEFGVIDQWISHATQYSTLVDLVAASELVSTQGAGRTIELFIGVVVPIAVLLVFQVSGQSVTSGWLQVQNRLSSAPSSDGRPESSRLPAKIVGWSTLLFAFVIFLLTLWSPKDAKVLLAYSATLFTVGMTACWVSKKQAESVRLSKSMDYE